MDIDWVLNGRPWSFDKNLICIQDFSTTILPTRLVFTHEPFWIQLHGMPLAAMTLERGELIGSIVGKVLTIDVNEDGVG